MSLNDKDLRAALASTLDDMGFPDQSEAVKEGESLATVRRDIDWNEGHVGEEDTVHVYAAARCAIDRVAKQIIEISKREEEEA